MRRFVLVLLLLLSSCAIPVRPIAHIVPDAHGGAHFEADQEREPHIPDGLGQGISMILSGIGPWGQLAAALLGGTGLLAAGHAHGKRKAKKEHVQALKPA